MPYPLWDMYVQKKQCNISCFKANEKTTYQHRMCTCGVLKEVTTKVARSEYKVIDNKYIIS